MVLSRRYRGQVRMREVIARDDEVEGLNELLRAIAPQVDHVELAQARRVLHKNLLGRTSAPLFVGRYKIVRYRGSGGHGTVYEAYDPVLRRQVGLKLLYPSFRTDPGTARNAASSADATTPQPLADRLLAEAQASAKIDDPRVVTLYDVGQTEPSPSAGAATYLVMQYVAGNDLRQWVERECPDATTVLSIAIDCARGLLAAHRCAVVHGDFKPENVMVTSQQTIKILDFGTARALATTTEATPLVGVGYDLQLCQGTPGYAAPEQYGRQCVDYRADQFSFCATFYEILGGQRLTQTTQLTWGESWTRDPIVRQLQPIFARGLQPRREDRYADIQELLNALESISTSAGRRASKHQWLAAGLLCVCTAVAVAVGGFYSISPEPSGACIKRTDFAGYSLELAGGQHQASFPTLASGITPLRERASKQLQTYFHRWQVARSALCGMHSGDATSDDSARIALSHAQACLDERERRVSLWLSSLDGAPELLLANAESAFESFGEPDACLALVRDDFVASTTTTKEPAPPCSSGILASLYELDANLQFLPRSEGLARSQALQAQLHHCGDSDLRAWVEIVDSSYELIFGDVNEALTGFEQAQQHAQASGQELLAIRAKVGRMRSHFANGANRQVDILMQELEAELHGRADTLGPELLARFYEHSTLIRLKQARYEEAERLALRSIALRDSYWEQTHPLVVRTRRYLVEVYYKQRRFDKAAELAQKTVYAISGIKGPQQIEWARFHRLLGSIAWRKGQYTQAVDHFESCAAMWSELVGPEDPRTLHTRGYIAAVYAASGDAQRSKSLLVELLAVARRRYGQEAQIVGDLSANLAEAQIALGEFEEAGENLNLAMRLESIRSRPLNPEIGYLLLTWANLELQRGQPKRARELCDQAIDLWRKTYGEEHPKMSWAYSCRGLAEIASQTTKKLAISTLELARARFDPEVDDPVNLAKIEFALAQALGRHEQAKARELAKRSAQILLASSGQHSLYAEPILAWLRNHPAPPSMPSEESR